MEFLEARVIDGEHLKLLRPTNVPAGSRVMVSVMPIEEAAEEPASWANAAVGGLAAAYGEHEPEYPLHLIKQPNPEFEP